MDTVILFKYMVQRAIIKMNNKLFCLHQWIDIEHIDSKLFSLWRHVSFTIIELCHACTLIIINADWCDCNWVMKVMSPIFYLNVHRDDVNNTKYSTKPKPIIDVKVN